MDNQKWFEENLREIGEFQLDRQSEIEPAGSEHKSRIDLVTEVDRESERRLVEALAEKFPADGILAEEELTRKSENDKRWIIDPLDGTTNYVHHHPFFGISVGREVEGKITEGYTYFPQLDNFYCARQGEGAYKNGEQLAVTTNDQPLNSLLATGFADMRTEDHRFNLPVFEKIIKEVQGIRRAGSAVHDMCLVAEGVFDGFWEYNLNAWDVAAGAILIREAGGRVTDMEGGGNWLKGKNIVASNDRMHGQLLDWVEPPV